MLKINRFEVNAFGENTYIVWDDTSRQAVIVDAGMVTEAEVDMVRRFVADNNLKVTQLVNTHLHLDHIFGVNVAKKMFDVKLHAAKGDEKMGRELPEYVKFYRIPMTAEVVEIDHYLEDGDKILIGKYELTVITLPGHSLGGIALYSPSGKFVITGDSLFRGSIGRTDLPGGNHADLVCNIQNKLMTLPDETTVYPGHGPATTLGTERIYNPYI